jgi:hypothetical protein
MPEQSCRHFVGPVAVEHRPGCVWVRCDACDVVVSGWLGDELDPFELIELRGAAEEVKDHLDRFHREVDLHDAEVLRLCAWKYAGTSAAPTDVVLVGTGAARVAD